LFRVNIVVTYLRNPKTTGAGDAMFYIMFIELWPRDLEPV